ncbi:hypothetical protein J7J26_03585 [Candidatus Micrarchaeota archaeon]|nr:hypothetical protein [Candidatus Micrarchaeota archaeon]
MNETNDSDQITHWNDINLMETPHVRLGFRIVDEDGNICKEIEDNMKKLYTYYALLVKDRIESGFENSVRRIIGDPNYNLPEDIKKQIEQKLKYYPSEITLTDSWEPEYGGGTQGNDIMINIYTPLYIKNMLPPGNNIRDVAGFTNFISDEATPQQFLVAIIMHETFHYIGGTTSFDINIPESGMIFEEGTTRLFTSALLPDEWALYNDVPKGTLRSNIQPKLRKSTKIIYNLFKSAHEQKKLDLVLYDYFNMYENMSTLDFMRVQRLKFDALLEASKTESSGENMKLAALVFGLIVLNGWSRHTTRKRFKFSDPDYLFSTLIQEDYGLAKDFQEYLKMKTEKYEAVDHVLHIFEVEAEEAHGNVFEVTRGTFAKFLEHYNKWVLPPLEISERVEKLKKLFKIDEYLAMEKEEENKRLENMPNQSKKDIENAYHGLYNEARDGIKAPRLSAERKEKLCSGIISQQYQNREYSSNPEASQQSVPSQWKRMSKTVPRLVSKPRGMRIPYSIAIKKAAEFLRTEDEKGRRSITH